MAAEINFALIAKAAGVSESTIKDWYKTGNIPFSKIRLLCRQLDVLDSYGRVIDMAPDELKLPLIKDAYRKMAENVREEQDGGKD